MARGARCRRRIGPVKRAPSVSAASSRTRLMDIAAFNEIKPAVNQIEINPFQQQAESVDFMRDLVSRGWMANTKYLTSIEAGTEIFTGTGQLDTDAYYCTIQ